jgi:hypothetical protein
VTAPHPLLDLPPARPALPVLFVKIAPPVCVFDWAPCLVTADRETALAEATGIIYYFESKIDKVLRYIVPMERFDAP